MLIFMKPTWLAITITAIFAVTGSTRADVIVDNTAELVYDVDPDTTTAGAQQFFTDNYAYQLTSVSLLLWDRPGGALTDVAIYSDDSFAPGSMLLDLGSVATTDDYNDTLYNFTPSMPLILAPNTAYWVVAQFNGVAVWDFTDSTNSLGSGFFGLYATMDGSSTDWYLDYGLPYQMAISGNRLWAAPEPSTFGLAGVGVFGVAAAGWRRRRVRA